MKKILSIITTLGLLFGFVSCDKLFDNLEGDLTKLTRDNMVSSEAGIERLLAQVYSYLPVNAFGYTDQYTMNAVESHGGDGGFNNNAYYGMNGFRTFWNWTGIRAINSFIVDVSSAVDRGIISGDYGRTLTGEAKFVRAYCYFAMVRAYGGVPIITEVLDQYYDGAGNEQLFAFTPRATEKETWDFIITELDEAILMLPDAHTDGEFRADKWAAYGLLARVSLYAASVSKYWTKPGTLANTYSSVANKKTYMEASYASAYYAKSIAACEAIIGNSRFSLYRPNPASISEAVTNLGAMFLTKQNSEYIFGQSMDDGVTTSGSNFDVLYSPAQTVTGSANSGRYSVALNLVDIYDNYDGERNAVDGTIITRTDNNESYYMPTPATRFVSEYSTIPFKKYDNISDPFKDKDARFQAWVLYPDASFRGQTIKIQGGLIKTDNSATIWAEAEEEIDDVTYYSFGDTPGKVSGFYNYLTTTTGNTVTTGFSLRKFLNPTASQLYIKTFWYDIRYAEILLTYCEAVLESAATTKYDTAEGYLNDIRHRAAFTDDVELTMDNVLHQRRLELAFEGDQLYTLHRRRDYYNQNVTTDITQSRRLALTPILDLRGGTPKYIFLRSIMYQEDQGGLSPSFHTTALGYYRSLSDYGVNKYEPNPIDE